MTGPLLKVPYVTAKVRRGEPVTLYCRSVYVEGAHDFGAVYMSMRTTGTTTVSSSGVTMACLGMAVYFKWSGIFAAVTERGYWVCWPEDAPVGWRPPSAALAREDEPTGEHELPRVSRAVQRARTRAWFRGVIDGGKK